MIYSMTGFGKASREFQGKRLSVEIKSLNSKQMDVKVRLPNEWRAKELELRKMVSDALERGKVDVYVSMEYLDGKRSASINAGVIKGYYDQVSQLKEDNAWGESFTMDSLLRLPDAVSMEAEEPDETEWENLKETIAEAIASTSNFRKEEGESLHTDLAQHLLSIQENAKQVNGLLGERRADREARLRQALIDQNISGVDENRFEQELIYYLEKLDINEEVVRLSQHCSYFSETLNGEKSLGKKLGFIAQEMGREINTMGAKANHTGIQQLVVQMKDDLEKIKEQVLNAL